MTSLLLSRSSVSSAHVEASLSYHPLSAADLHLSRLCVQPDLQPDHLFPEAHSSGPSASAAEFAAMTAAVFPSCESPVSQRISALVSDLSQRVGQSRSRERRHSIQMFLDEASPPPPGLPASLPVFQAAEEDFQLPSLFELRSEALSEPEPGVLAAKEALALTLSTSPGRRGPRGRQGPAQGEMRPPLGHRRVFSDGLPADVLAQVAMNRSMSSLPIGAPRPLAMSTLTTDSDSTCLTCPSMSDASDVATFAVGPDFEVSPREH